MVPNDPYALFVFSNMEILIWKREGFLLYRPT